MSRLISDGMNSGEAFGGLHADFNLMSDEAKVDVLKAQIAEHEKTERERIEQEAQTCRNLHNTDGYHAVRFLFVVFLLAIVAAASCVGVKKLELEDQRIRDAAARGAR